MKKVRASGDRNGTGGSPKPPRRLPPFSAPDWPATRVEMRALAKIFPHPQNPRTHPPEQITQLARSMKDDGVTMPILVDEAGEIIAGAGRRLAAIANGFEKYPVVVARGWTDEQKRAARVKDNSIALLSGWDAALIRGEITGLKLAGYDVQLLGFPEAQLRGWGIALGTDGAADPDVIPERPKKPVVRKGDLWVLGDHQLLCGDATSEGDVIVLLDDAKPNLMVTDPPYGVDYDPEWRAVPKFVGSRQRTAGLGAKKGPSFSSLGIVHNDGKAGWSAAWKLFPGNVVYAWGASLTSDIAVVDLEAGGFKRRAQIIWRKSHFAIGRGDYQWQHEICWYAVRPGAKSDWCSDRKQTTVWDITSGVGFTSKVTGPNARTGHSTQKPVECMKRPIENNSRKGDFIYDPFCGSGTTIIAGEMTGRRVLGIEIDPGYVQCSIERWQTFTGRKATLDGKTLEQVAKARRTGRAKGAIDDDATRDSRKPVPREDAGGNGGKRPVRKGRNARQPAPRREPASEPSALAGDS